jgi:hypothetical protein
MRAVIGLVRGYPLAVLELPTDLGVKVVAVLSDRHALAGLRKI